MASMFASASPTPEPPYQTRVQVRKTSETSDSDDPNATNLSVWQAVNASRESIKNVEKAETPKALATRDEDEDSDLQEVIHARPAAASKRSRVHVEITIPADFDRDEYEDLTALAHTVSQVISERGGHFKVLFEDGHQDMVSISGVFAVILSNRMAA